MANGLYKIPHRRPPVQEAGTYATPTTQGEAQNTGLHYTGSHLIGGKRVHLLARENVGLENKPNFDTYRFSQFGKKWREVNAQGKPVDPEYTDLLKPIDKIKKGWSGLVVEDIDPVVGKVKYRQYGESKRKNKEAASSVFDRELLEAGADGALGGLLRQDLATPPWERNQHPDWEARAVARDAALRARIAKLGTIDKYQREDWVEFDMEQTEGDPWVVK